MQFEIQGGQMPVVICKLQAGEAMYTESGGMGWMTANIDMSTNMEGGLLAGFARKVAGESMFLTTYTCKGGIATIAFPSSFPGSILAFELVPGQSLVCQKKAFLAAERTVQLEMFLKKNIGVGFFGGEGFIMQKVTGPGKVFLEIDGSAIRQTLQPGEILKVDPGHIAIMTPSLIVDITMVKGFKNVFFGGEGLFLAEVRGPGDIWLQTIPAQNVAKMVIPFIPQNRSN
ncbi:MAG: TIGR00266 family protein [Clostridiales bacterium]|nr:TIGR00266 family protein [Clostridiales bacterium]